MYFSSRSVVKTCPSKRKLWSFSSAFKDSSSELGTEPIQGVLNKLFTNSLETNTNTRRDERINEKKVMQHPSLISPKALHRSVKLSKGHKFDPAN
jgi:hypothetical protein